MNLVIKNKLLIIILFIAIFLRFYQIANVPPSLNWDEVSHGYNAYSILKTGSDEWGVSFPTIFRAYGDYKLPVYIYLTAISEQFFGLNEFAVRLPSMLSGVLLVYVTYLLVKELFKDEKIALLSSLLVAVEPWGLFLSRVAVEANVAVFLIALGAYLFVKFSDNKKGIYLMFSFLFFGLSVWAYNSARIFTPLLVVTLIFLYRKYFKYFLKPTVILLIFLVPMFVQLLNSSGQARYSNVQILDEGALNEIISFRNNLDYPDPFPRLISNKVTYFTLTFIKNYVSHFNPNFLFINGGSNYQFNIPNYGLLYLVNFPFFVLGTYFLLRKFNKTNYQVIVIWLVLAPIASSITREAPHTLRSILFLPAVMIVSALGFFELFNNIKKVDYKKILLFTYLIILGIFTLEYVNKYFGEYRRDYSWSWQYGNKEMVNYVKQNYDKYDQIIITKKSGEIHEFVLFYWPWDPSGFRSDENLVRFNQSNWYWLDRFDRFYFINDWEIENNTNRFVTESDLEVDCTNKKCLLVTAGNKDFYEWNLLDEIRFLDGSVAFELYEN